MSDEFKVSGKRVKLGLESQAWTFEPRPGGWVIASRERADGSVERRRISVTERKGKLSATLSGMPWFGEVISTQRGTSASGAGDSDLVAQFPGKVRKVLVQAGDSVKEGDGLVLVEAMKMEFAVKAPFAAKVRKVLVQEGQQLQPGDRFVDLEPVANGK